MKRKLTQSQIDDEAIRRGIRATASILGKTMPEMAKMMQIGSATLYRHLDDPGAMTLHELRRAEAAMRAVGVDWRALREGVS